MTEPKVAGLPVGPPERLLLHGGLIAVAVKVHPVTVRKWAAAGLLTRHGRDSAGRTLYDFDEAVEVATRRGVLGADGLPTATATISAPGSESAPSRCELVIRRKDCGLPVVADSPVPICQVHLRQAYTYIADQMVKRAEERTHHRAERSEPENADRPRPLVYYAERGNLIKIGTTIALRQRMAALMVDRLLATEPGDYQLEGLRLKQFRHLLVRGREWHRRDDALLSHIAMIRRHYGAPPDLAAPQ